MNIETYKLNRFICVLQSAVNSYTSANNLPRLIVGKLYNRNCYVTKITVMLVDSAIFRKTGTDTVYYEFTSLDINDYIDKIKFDLQHVLKVKYNSDFYYI